MRIYIAVAGLSEPIKARLTTALAGHQLIFSHELGGDGARQAAVTAAEVVFGNVPPAWLTAARQLRWVQLDSAGVNAYLGLHSTRAGHPVLLTNLSDFYGQAVAEAILAGILALYRQLPRLLVAQRERRWIKSEVESAIGQLHRARVVILGAGAIGRRVAALLQPFEGEVRFFARRAPEAKLRTLADLDTALVSTDVLINTLPETPTTIGILSRERLSRLPDTAVVVNAGRGSALDETALLNALDAQRLGGAVLDVTAVEPLPPEHPFWTHPHIFLTQHTCGRFPGETKAKVARFLGNFGCFVRGEPLTGVIDPSRGY